MTKSDEGGDGFTITLEIIGKASEATDQVQIPGIADRCSDALRTLIPIDRGQHGVDIEA